MSQHVNIKGVKEMFTFIIRLQDSWLFLSYFGQITLRQVKSDVWRLLTVVIKTSGHQRNFFQLRQQFHLVYQNISDQIQNKNKVRKSNL